MTDPAKAHARRAGILCGDSAFQRFAGERSGLSGAQFTSTAAAHFLRRECQIASRKDLDTDAGALARFEALTTDFDAWRGRIPALR
ncbi:hypothetical protein [Pararhodobacter zhoushanensis]|uniref:Uncharacterized protein n=1 Tax=Pararhodobacter zhoushanensis TaxID=2479545 RepID=A0ABT3H4D8_9RHOB|nr:hypothetical protein [Pararhodobacter zhoushanensis]MCW1934560.1 hypothetical protein [Pararhodobacter zhoushanensis]